MIKDLVVNLALAAERDPAAEFALSVCRRICGTCAALHFNTDPIMPIALMDDVPPDVIDTQRAENQRAANAATSRFDGAARVASVLSETRIIESTMAGVATRFAHIARRFDLSIVAQAKPEADGPEALIVEQALFGSGRPVLVVPYIQTAPFKTDRVDAVLGWQPDRRSRSRRRHAFPLARQSGRDLYR